MKHVTLESAMQRLRERRSPYPMQPPCPESEIADLASTIKKELGAEVPERFFSLLCIANGFEFSALQAFGSRTARNVASDMWGRESFVWGIVEANLSYRGDHPAYDQLLLFAAREGYVYAQDIAAGFFIKLSQTEDEPRKWYATYDEMMIEAIQDALTY